MHKEGRLFHKNILESYLLFRYNVLNDPDVFLLFFLFVISLSSCIYDLYKKAKHYNEIISV